MTFFNRDIIDLTHIGTTIPPTHCTGLLDTGPTWFKQDVNEVAKSSSSSIQVAYP
jgi:hypothetical protein